MCSIREAGEDSRLCTAQFINQQSFALWTLSKANRGFYEGHGWWLQFFSEYGWCSLEANRSDSRKAEVKYGPEVTNLQWKTSCLNSYTSKWQSTYSKYCISAQRSHMECQGRFYSCSSTLQLLWMALELLSFSTPIRACIFYNDNLSTFKSQWAWAL